MTAPHETRTIPALVEASADAFGDAVAIEDRGTVLTFREVFDHSRAAARAFIAAGLEHGDRVGIWAPNLWEWIIAAIGLQSVGGVLVTLNTRYKGGEAAFILRKSRAKLLCTVGDFLDTNYVAMLAGHDLPALERIISLDGVGEGALPWDDFLTGGTNVSNGVAGERARAVSPDDPCDIIFTSGTTGDPKGAVTAHGQNLRTFEVWTDVIGLREGDRHLIIPPFFHSFGYKAGWLSDLMRGATILPVATFDPAEVMERVSSQRVSVLPGPPTIYQSLITHPDRERYDLSNLRLAATGAAPTPVELIRQMREVLGFETVVTAYGLTEACGVVSICRPEDDPEIIATTSGRAMPDVEVKCVDDDGKEVPRGEPGEIWVRGYNVMQGYFDAPEETAKAIDADGWLHTGDVGVMDERGYLAITDRIKDMFIMGGLNCYPAEIEKIMYDSGLFAAVAVLGIPDERMGEVGAAWVVPAPGRDVTPESVVAWCRDNMANYKVPRRVEVVSELPTNASGKVMKFKLREQVA